jgi:hypothetical protein
MVYEACCQRKSGRFLDKDAKRAGEALDQGNSKHSVRRANDWSEVVRYVMKLKDASCSSNVRGDR